MTKTHAGTRYTNPLNADHWLEQDGKTRGGDYMRHRAANIRIAVTGAIGLQRIIDRCLTEERNFQTEGGNEHHGLTPYLTECLLCAQHVLLQAANREIEHLCHDKNFLDATTLEPGASNA